MITSSSEPLDANASRFSRCVSALQIIPHSAAISSRSTGQLHLIVAQAVHIGMP